MICEFGFVVTRIGTIPLL
jgi:tetrahydrodipicolinate N-succinyltransferase